MSKYAHISNVKDGVAFSDPWYDENVWCQYRKEFTDENWFMKLDTSKGDYDSLCFQMSFGRPTVVGNVRLQETEEGITASFPDHYRVETVELGIDTARIFCGSYKDFHDFGESIAFDTGGDGMFGSLFVFTVKGEENPAGFALFCSFDEEFMTEEHFFNHVVSSFDGKEISKEEFLDGVSKVNISNRILLAQERTHAIGSARDNGTPEKSPNDPER